MNPSFWITHACDIDSIRDICKYFIIQRRAFEPSNICPSCVDPRVNICFIVGYATLLINGKR